ncbi:MAG: phenylalanine--tRNA ligase subunit alpha [Candidatus Omnitrophica bacterium]|jgi:phenylalanyl-tRNA synthetase alpha chain|nr:phenylalanine--tRNA ligase subunit alpha [Candidatus Omnitrophota bacterium]MDD5500562.1 phenylalanine--tRNA ligase subunit alpha [Candidatus Omnitrophota bacterium]
MDINAIQAQLEDDLSAASSAQDIEAIRVKYLGRKGVLADLTGAIGSLPPEERGVFGREVNALKLRITESVSSRLNALNIKASISDKKETDIGLPGIAQELGSSHPIVQVIEEICGIFARMGFSVLEGPEIETEFNNFTGLNIPLDHPSRDAFDTFYLKDYPKLLLRSHTSPMQVRVMKNRKPPLAIVVPGRVYRPDAVDASHLFMFHQIEGLLVDENIKFSDLKGVLEFFAKSVFGSDIKMRFRPHFFPFTEPSAEVDISCIMCKGKGCSVCGRKGWLEILGAGMVHPNVFKHAGYEKGKFTGFAFGMGVERIAMLKYGINDIRLFFENDLRFLKQF